MSKKKNISKRLLLIISLFLLFGIAMLYYIEVNRVELWANPLSLEELNQLRTDSAFLQEGIASRYHSSLNGLPTTSGTLYDSNCLTAAHKKLPLGTRVRVINLQTRKWVSVEINDRGPFIKNRIIDLSHAAADSIGISETIGISRVILLNDQ